MHKLLVGNRCFTGSVTMAVWATPVGLLIFTVLTLLFCTKQPHLLSPSLLSSCKVIYQCHSPAEKSLARVPVRVTGFSRAQINLGLDQNWIIDSKRPIGAGAGLRLCEKNWKYWCFINCYVQLEICLWWNLLSSLILVLDLRVKSWVT